MLKNLFSFLFLNVFILGLSASPEFGFRTYIVKHKKKATITEYELGNVSSFSSMEITMEAGDIFYGAVWDNTYYGSEFEHYAPVKSMKTIRSGSVKCSIQTEDISKDHGITITIPGTYTVNYDSDTQTFSWKAPEGADALLVIGDMNGDGLISIEDIALLTNTLLGKREVEFHQCSTPPSAPILVEEITLNENNLSLKEGETFTLTATVAPENATNADVVWHTSNPLVAEVNEEGQIKAIGVGNCVITATTADGSEVSAICELIVRSKVVEFDNPTITKAGTTTIEMEVTEGQTLSFDYSVTLKSHMYLIDSSWPSGGSDVLTISIEGESGSTIILEEKGPKISTQGSAQKEYKGTADYTFTASGNYVLTIKLVRNSGSGGAQISNIKIQ